MMRNDECMSLEGQASCEGKAPYHAPVLVKLGTAETQSKTFVPIETNASTGPLS